MKTTSPPRVGDSPAWVVGDQPDAAECRHGRDGNSGQASYKSHPSVCLGPDQYSSDTDEQDQTDHEDQHAGGRETVAVEGSFEVRRLHALKGESPDTVPDEHDANGAHEHGSFDQQEQTPLIRFCTLSRGVRRGLQLRHQNPSPERNSFFTLSHVLNRGAACCSSAS